MDARVVLFGKLPRQGRVKTRLVPPLSEAQAVALYRAFLGDQLAFLRGFAHLAGTEWCADARPDARHDAELLAQAPTVTLQGPGDLGRRMQRAFERSHAAGSRATVVLGADCPTLPASRVERALELLRGGSPAVLVPAPDGGYVLVGLRRPVAGLFEGIGWGGPAVLAATRERAAGLGLRLEELEPWPDVDDLADLRRLRDELREHAEARRRAPRTARRLLDSDLATVL